MKPATPARSKLRATGQAPCPYALPLMAAKMAQSGPARRRTAARLAMSRYKS